MGAVYGGLVVTSPLQHPTCLLVYIFYVAAVCKLKSNM